MFRLVFSHLGPVEEELHRQAFPFHQDIRKARNNIPRQVDGVLLNVRKGIYGQPRPVDSHGASKSETFPSHLCL